MDAMSTPSPLLAGPPDRYLTCQNCAITFVWTGWEQQTAEQAPHLCPGCRHLLTLTRRLRGTVKWYDRRKGFGFITASDGSEVFVHRSNLVGVHVLRRGQVVAFRREAAENGPLAVDIELLAAAEPETPPSPHP